MRCWRILSVFPICIFLNLSTAWSLQNKQNQSPPRSGPLTFEERVTYQRAIEEVYWRHRIWPKENKSPKPFLDQFVPDSLIRTKVEDYLKKSNALTQYWQHPIQPEQLQAEVNRMIKNTNQPVILRELFSALGNDPEVIAECLGRPVLVDRLIHNWYANDERYHGGLKQRIENELRGATVQSIRALSGHYSEIETVQSAKADPSNQGKILNLNQSQWNDRISSTKKLFGQQNIPVGKLTRLQQDADRFYVVTVLEKESNRMKIATVEWRKKSFGEWWVTEKVNLPSNIVEVPYFYNMSPIPNTTTCTDDTWAETNHSEVPEPHYGHTVVWTGSEMIIWGGNTSGITSTGGRYDPAIDSWAPTSLVNVPDARFDHTAIWTGHEMIVWGGSTYGPTRLSSGGRYNPASDSWTPTTTNNVPEARQLHTAVWTGDEMIVWGGRNQNGNYVSSGGRYDPRGNSWTATNNVSSLARGFHTAVWTGNTMIIWGGLANNGNSLNTGGIYDPSADSWTLISNIRADAPDARYNHTAVWTGSEMIVWGGRVAGFPDGSSTGGRYDPSSDQWFPTSISNAPLARFSHTAIWTGSEMIIWGGMGASGGYTVELSSGGRYDPFNDSWSSTSLTNAPEPRVSHSAVWADNEMIVWGGAGPGPFIHGPLSTGGRYDPSTDSWIPTNNGVPEARIYHSAIWTGTEMIVWGGSNGFGDVATGGRYDPAIDHWTSTTLLNAPEARALHAAVWTGMEMIIWGGGTPNIDLSTGGRYIPVSDSWIAMNTTDAPVARSSPTGVWSGEEMIVWGGCDYSFTCYSTGGRYNPGTDTWVATSTTNAPSGRNLHTAVWTSTQMIIWGGHDQNGMFNSGGIYDPANDTWTPTSTVNAPSAREDHAAVFAGNKMIIWGGVDTDYASTGGLYDPSNNSWTPTNTSGAPEARQLPTAVWIGDEMIVWGGIGQSGYLNTGGRYNRTLNTWSALTTLNAPTARVFHTAIWTGTEMIVWGGRNNTPDFFNTGGRYCAAFRPSVYVDDASVTEGNSGSVDMNFNVNLFVPSTQDVTINYQTADDTAKTSDSDYQSANSSITIPAGQTQGTITIHVNGDTKSETNETFFVNVTSVTSANIGDGEARGTITNDDSAPSLSISDVNLPEGNGGQTPLTFQVLLSTANSVDTTVQYATADGTATASSGDYVIASGTLTIPAGSTSTTLTVFVNGDSVFEPNETFFVNLSNPTNATISDGQGIGGIINDEANGPFLTIWDVAKKEGKTGTSAFTFTVNLSAMLAQSVTVHYATADGTATVTGNDYVAASGSLTIPAGMKKGTITVQVRGDRTQEADETFFVNLSNPIGAVILDPQGIGTIQNDD